MSFYIVASINMAAHMPSTDELFTPGKIQLIHKIHKYTVYTKNNMQRLKAKDVQLLQKQRCQPGTFSFVCLGVGVGKHPAPKSFDSNEISGGNRGCVSHGPGIPSSDHWDH